LGQDDGVTGRFDPFIREVSSPLTEEMLRPLDPRCRWVQFSRALSDTDYAVLADWLADYPSVILRVYGSYDGSITDLDFLRYFPTLLGFEADGLYDSLVSLDGLNYLPPQLRHLGLGQTRTRLSLAPLARFTALRRLSLEGHTKDLDVVAQLHALTSLTLRSITLADLSLLRPLTRLRALDLKLGGTSNLALLPQIGALQYVELWRVRGLHDLNPVAEIPTLEYLFLQALGQLTTLPPLAGCTRLTRVHVETLKGIADLSPLLTAPALTQLAIFDMPQLRPADVAVLSAHPTLRHLSVGLGSRRKNDEVTRLLPLPPLPNHDRHPALTAVD
jgi:hypothetical protein